MVGHFSKRSILSYVLFFIIFVAFLPIAIVLSTHAHAELIPPGNNPLYYKMGGGQPVSVPAYDGTQSIPLKVEGSIGVGYNCGLFNPLVSITNSLNGIKNSFQNLQQTVINNATAAITQFPLYAIARADPSLYNLLTNGLLGAQEDLKVSTKSCHQLQSEIAKGQNPYNDWLQASLGNNWKYHMSLVNHNNLKAINEDINEVKQEVEKDNGDNGVPWVLGMNTARGIYAGGRYQPAIYVLHDAVLAGYNVILNRTHTDTSAPVKTDENHHLVDTWANPAMAAQWVTTVLGDEKITIFAGGEKASSPGVGLLPDNQAVTKETLKHLQSLVSNEEKLTLQNLKNISAPGIMINTAIIEALRQKPSLEQAIFLNKLSQEIATAKVIDKAFLAKQILEEGSQIPEIYGNKPAYEQIQKALKRLDTAINDLLFNIKVKKQLVSETAALLLSTTQADEAHSTLTQNIKSPPPLMEDGAIKP